MSDRARTAGTLMTLGIALLLLSLGMANFGDGSSWLRFTTGLLTGLSIVASGAGIYLTGKVMGARS